MSRKVLMAIGAHADDIEFNAGGTICKYLDRGYELVYVLSTNNMAGKWSSLDRSGKRVSRDVPWYEIMPQRKKEAGNAAAHFRTAAVHLNHPQRHYRNGNLEAVELRYGAPRPDCVPENIPSILTAHEDPASRKALAALIETHRPEAVLTHDTIQADMEHIGTSLLVAKTVRECGYGGMLLYWPSIDVPPCGEIYNSRQTYIDISDYYERKMEVLRIHACQIPTTEHFTFRPWENGLNCSHVEAFAIGQRGTGGAEFTEEILKHAF